MGIFFEDLVVLLERNPYGHPLAGLLWERQFKKALHGTWLGKSTKFGMLIRSTENKKCFSVCVDDITMTGKKQSLAPLWTDIDERR